MSGSVSVEQRLRAVVDRAARDPELTGIVAAVERPATGLSWTGAAGECLPDTAFFVASTTKLHTSAIVLRLVERGEIGLDDPVVEVLGDDSPAGDLDRLHVHSGVDHTAAITVRHLMAQSSGVADYFQGRPPGGRPLDETLLSGVDQGWTTREAVARAREIGGAFPPGHRRRALYSDTNYQLLGAVTETVLGMPYAEALHREITGPLGLAHTWVHPDPSGRPVLPLHHRGRVLEIPLAMASFGADGGVVSTAADLMVFVRAFFEGGLFDPAMLDGLRDYRRIFFPLQYGVGFARFALPRALGGEELLGHSGLSGAFAFVAPRPGVYVTGTVNDIARPARSFRLMQRLVRAAA